MRPPAAQQSRAVRSVPEERRDRASVRLRGDNVAITIWRPHRIAQKTMPRFARDGIGSSPFERTKGAKTQARAMASMLSGLRQAVTPTSGWQQPDVVRSLPRQPQRRQSLERHQDVNAHLLPSAAF
jgi:hypothetical protein